MPEDPKIGFTAPVPDRKTPDTIGSIPVSFSKHIDLPHDQQEWLKECVILSKCRQPGDPPPPSFQFWLELKERAQKERAELHKTAVSRIFPLTDIVVSYLLFPKFTKRFFKRIPDPPLDQQISTVENKLKKILNVIPDSELKAYESLLGIEILNIERKKLPPYHDPFDDGDVPIGNG